MIQHPPPSGEVKRNTAPRHLLARKIIFGQLSEKKKQQKFVERLARVSEKAAKNFRKKMSHLEKQFAHLCRYL